MPEHKDKAAHSLFLPGNLLRESRRQNEIPLGGVPGACVPDSDGNLVEYLGAKNEQQRNEH